MAGAQPPHGVDLSLSRIREFPPVGLASIVFGGSRGRMFQLAHDFGVAGASDSEFDTSRMTQAMQGEVRANRALLC